MKYTKNLHNKLLLEGFEFKYEYVSPPDEDQLYYTVYQKGMIEVTVCDSHHSAVVLITPQDKKIKHLTLSQLKKLDKLINKK